MGDAKKVRILRTLTLKVRILRTIIVWQADDKKDSPVRVISKSRLRQFWLMAGSEDSEGPLRAWYTHVGSRSVSWTSWAEVKADFATASHVGSCVVFNIGGNKYRLITRVLYPSHKVFILKVMTHREYDDGKWKEECGCHEPPPKKTKIAGKKSVVKKKAHRKGTRRKEKGR